MGDHPLEATLFDDTAIPGASFSTTAIASGVSTSSAAVPCPPGKDFYEKIDGYDNKFDCWEKVNGVTTARIWRKKEKTHFYLPATATDFEKAKNLCGPTWKRHKANATPREKVEGAQRNNSNIVALLKQTLVEADEQGDALSSAAIDLGGSGKQPAQQVLSTAQLGDCPVCLETVTLGVKGSTLSNCCNTPFHEVCLSKWLLQNGECPMCRDQRTAPVAADDADPQDSDDETFCADCLDGTDGPNNPILVCSGPHATEVGQCKFALHKNCCNRPPANVVCKNCWCPQHWSRASKGDIKLEGVSAPSSARTTADDRTARAAAKAILVPEKKKQIKKGKKRMLPLYPLRKRTPEKMAAAAEEDAEMDKAEEDEAVKAELLRSGRKPKRMLEPLDADNFFNLNSMTQSHAIQILAQAGAPGMLAPKRSNIKIGQPLFGMSRGAGPSKVKRIKKMF